MEIGILGIIDQIHWQSINKQYGFTGCFTNFLKINFLKKTLMQKLFKITIFLLIFNLFYGIHVVIASCQSEGGMKVELMSAEMIDLFLLQLDW